MQSLRLAFRALSKTPFITTIAILSLALGIGANSAIFSLYEQFLLASLPVPNPHDLVNFGAPGPKPGSTSCSQAGDCSEVFSYPMFRDLEQAEVGLTGLAAHRAIGANLAYSSQVSEGEALLVSGGYFPTLELRPSLGRLLQPADDETPGAHPVAVLGHDYWNSTLGGDSSILNETISINGFPMTVVGVAPRGFRGTTLGNTPDVYVPISMLGEVSPGSFSLENRRNYWVYCFGRLESGASVEQLAARINPIYNGIIREVEAPLQNRESMTEEGMARFLEKEVVVEAGPQGQSNFQENASMPITLLLAVTAFVLLIACANIANLLLARGARRAPEMAIRGSLGANRRQLLIPLLTESMVLAVLGGLASLGVAFLTLRVLHSLLPPGADRIISLDLRPEVLAFTAVLALATGLVFGMYPALHSTRRDLVTALKSSARQASGAHSAARFRSILVTGQIALSMALLVASGLFVKSMANIQQVELGLQKENLVTFAVSPVRNGYEPERSRILFQRIEEELAALPGVRNVTAARVPVLAGSSWGTSVSVEGFEEGPGIDDNSRFNTVGPGYFGTLGIPLLAGREFTTADNLDAPQVAIVNEAFTRKFNLNGREAVGKWMSTGDSEELNIQIVGVVQDAKYNDVRQGIPPVFATPYLQASNLGSLFFYARTEREPESIIRAVPPMIAELDPVLPVEELMTLQDQINENLTGERIISTLSSTFALLATLLAAIGLYGVLAYTVAQRTNEIGLRIALGAASKRIHGLVLSQVGKMAIIGSALGLAAGVAIGKAAESMLYEMQGFDPTVLIVATILMGAVAFGAGFIPAHRASRIDPMVALRYE